MIYTITTNPSLDYYMRFDKELSFNEQNRSNEEMYDAGGKGVNVSIFLNYLGIQSGCLGFLGGFTKDYFLDKLVKYPSIQPLFTNIKENTRINIKADSNKNISLNAKGPSITSDEFEKFFARTNRIYDTDYVVLSGNIQEELVDKIVRLVGTLSTNGTKVILDTDDIIVNSSLEFSPWVIKLNDRNSGINEEEIISKAKSYIEKGTCYVLYSSLVSDAFYLISKDAAYKINRLNNTSAMMGSGDAMIAGFLYSSLRGADQGESFKYATACSCLLRLIDNKISRNEIEDSVKNIEIIKL